MTIPGNYAVQWRAFVGPVFRESTSVAFWDWSALNHAAAYDPTSVIANTTLASSVNFASDTTITLTDASTYPTGGGFWIGPGSSTEIWAYTEYHSKSGNQVTILRPDYKAGDLEYAGLHTSGAVVRFWWELDVTDGAFAFSEFIEGNLNASNWRGRLSGIAIPVPGLRKNHLFLLQKRDLSGSTWGNWVNELVGWIDNVEVEDDAKKVRTWAARVSSISGRMGQLEADGVRSGSEDLEQRISVQASSTLSFAYKEASTGEFAGAEPPIAPARAADAKQTPPWISERFIGEDNDYTLQANNNFDGVSSTSVPMITQVHLWQHPGSTGTRWIEILFQASASTFNHYLITQDGHCLDFEATGYSVSASAGDRIVIAENASLFNQIHPSNDAIDIVDVSEIQYRRAQWKIDTFTLTGSPTGGSFKLSLGLNGAPASESNAIPYNASASTFFGEIAPIPSIGNYLVEGAAGGPWTVQWYQNQLLEDFSPLTDWTLSTNNLTGGSSPSVSIVNVQQGLTAITTATGSSFFDSIDATNGWLVLYNSLGPAAMSTLGWGTPTRMMPAFLWNDNGSDANPGTRRATYITTPGQSQSARYIFDPAGTETEATDYWSVGRASMPGYNADGTEWLLLTLPSIDLELQDDIPDSITTSFVIADAGGASGDGLPDSGTIQIGSEQIGYTSINRATGVPSGVTRGANGTLATTHLAGDPIYILDDMQGNLSSEVATDAPLVKQIVLWRKTGQPTIEDFTIRLSNFRLVRNPNDLAYTDDYVTLGAWIVTGASWVAGSEYDTYTLDLTSTPFRVRKILIEMTKMDTQPYRAAVNEVEVLLDNSVIDSSSYIDNATIGATMEQIITDSGLPAGAVTDNTTGVVEKYTTARGNLWGVMLDLADFGSKRLTIGRDSKLTIDDDTFWTPASSALPGPSDETGELTRDELASFEVEWINGHNIGQIQLSWRSPDGNSEGDVKFPSDSARDESGEVVAIGPLIYADATAASNAAKRYFYMRRRPHTFIGDVVGGDQNYRPLQIWGTSWVLGSGYRTINRTWMLDRIEHELSRGAWAVTISGVQLDREDYL